MYQPATQEQKTEMVKLSNSPQITPFEKTKVFRDIHNLSSERAAVMIARLKKWVGDRQPRIVGHGPKAPIMRGYIRKGPNADWWWQTSVSPVAHRLGSIHGGGDICRSRAIKRAINNGHFWQPNKGAAPTAAEHRAKVLALLNQRPTCQCHHTPNELPDEAYH